MKVNWFKILIYASLGFLVYYLIKHNFLDLPSIEHPINLGIALLLLFGSFTILALRWFFILKASQMPVKLSDALISSGFTIFTKYIPGKVLMIIGKTTLIKQKYHYKTDALITASFNDQLIAIWTGLGIGSICLFENHTKTLFYIVGIAWLLFGFTIFNSTLFNLLKKVLKFFLKKELNIAILPFKKLIKLLPLHFAYWFLIGIGFYFLFQSVYSTTISFHAIFAFPLSIVLGIISLLSPGGLGVREALLAFYFSQSLNSVDAISLSSISRMWFLLGEGFIFGLALLVKLLNRTKK